MLLRMSSTARDEESDLISPALNLLSELWLKSSVVRIVPHRFPVSEGFCIEYIILFLDKFNTFTLNIVCQIVGDINVISFLDRLR